MSISETTGEYVSSVSFLLHLWKVGQVKLAWHDFFGLISLSNNTTSMANMLLLRTSNRHRDAVTENKMQIFQLKAVYECLQNTK